MQFVNGCCAAFFTPSSVTTAGRESATTRVLSTSRRWSDNPRRWRTLSRARALQALKCQRQQRELPEFVRLRPWYQDAAQKKSPFASVPTLRVLTYPRHVCYAHGRALAGETAFPPMACLASGQRSPDALRWPHSDPYTPRSVLSPW